MPGDSSGYPFGGAAGCLAVAPRTIKLLSTIRDGARLFGSRDSSHPLLELRLQVELNIPGGNIASL